MKNILIAVIIALLCIVFFLAYKLRGINSSAIYNPGNSCAARICKDYSNAPWRGKINGYLAKMIADNYKRDQGKFFIGNGEQVTLEPDATSAWFPLEVLKKYLWEIEMKNCGSKCMDSLGLRIYYAKYPDSSSRVWRDLGMEMMSQYANHHTLFMVPTYWDRAANLHRDYDPWTGCRARISTDSLASLKGSPVFFVGGNSEAQNHGSLIPPDAALGNAF